MYSLDSLVVPLGFPLFQKHFETWRPLSEQAYGLDVVRLWKEVLEEKQPMGYNREQNQQGYVLKVRSFTICFNWTIRCKTQFDDTAEDEVGDDNHCQLFLFLDIPC